jgi:tetratricopeptide (TPR) repeat protein
MQDLSPDAEQAWRSLRRHLERSTRFTLVFLSSAYPPALDEVRHRLEAALQFRASRLEIVALEDGSADWVAPLEAALVQDEARIQMRSPVWLALDHHPGDPAMNQQRDAVLASLNQQRTRLERLFQRPLLIALPASYLSRTWEVAPDLWTIRGIVAELPAQAVPRSSPEPSPPVQNIGGDPEALSPVAEWRRVAARASADPESASPFVAHAAVEAALENGSLAVAMQIAEQGLALARARTNDGLTERQRDLAIALDDIGRVAREQWQLEAAEQAFAESLTVSQRLLQEVGESPTGSRDLSVSLDNVGNVARQQGQLEEAEQAFAESLAVRRRLLQEVGESPTGLRDLSVSLDHVGNVASELGRLEAAEQAFAESLAVSRRLLQEMGESPTGLRDLSVSLNNVGKVARQQGRLEAAAQAFAESLVVSRRLLHAVGESPTGLRDLSVSLDNVGNVASELGRLEAAEQAFAESLAVRRRLDDKLRESPPATKTPR